MDKEQLKRDIIFSFLKMSSYSDVAALVTAIDPNLASLVRNILSQCVDIAEISVILGRYKNPTSVFSDGEYETWNEETRPYWDANRHEIHKYLTVLSDVKIQPTATNPLTGYVS